MADNDKDLLQQAQDIQRAKLLEQAKSIQQQRLSTASPPAERSALGFSSEGAGKALNNSAPDIAGLAGQELASPLGPVASIGAGAAGRAGARMAQTAANDYQEGGLSQVLRPPTMSGTIQATKDLGSDVMATANQVMGGKIIGNVMDRGAEALHSLAETKAFKAAGAMLKDFRSAFNKDGDKINELGRTMLDNGMIKAGDSVASIAQKAEGVRRETGKQIGQVYDKVLDSITDPASNVPPEVAAHIQTLGFHPEAQAEELKTMLAQKYRGLPGSTNALKKGSEVVDELAMNGNNLTPDHALELKGHVDAMINWSKKARDLPLEQDVLKDVRNYIQGRLNAQVQALDETLGNNQSQELSRLNKLYGNVSTIANVARDRALRESANQSFGLGEKLMATAGAGAGSTAGAVAARALGLKDPLLAGAAALAGGTVGGVVGGTSSLLARRFGNAAMATGAEAAGNMLRADAPYAPAMSTSIRSFLDRKKPEQSGPGIVPANRLTSK